MMKSLLGFGLVVCFFGCQGQDIYLTPRQGINLQTRGSITQFSFSKGDKFLAIGDENGTVNVWDVQANQLAKQITHKSGILLLRFHPVSDKLTVVLETGEIKDFQQNTFLPGSESAFTNSPKLISYEPAGNLLLAQGSNGIEMFDGFANMMANQIPFATKVKKPLFLGFDRFGQQVSLVTETGQVLTWNPLTQRLVRELKLQSGEYTGSRSIIHSASNNYGGDKFVVGMQEVFLAKGSINQTMQRNQPERRNMLVFYEWISGQEAKRIPLRYRPDLMAQGPTASDVAYVSTDVDAVWMVNYSSGSVSSSLKLQYAPTAISFSTNNELFAVGGSKGEVFLYDVARNSPAEIKISSPALDRGYSSHIVTDGQLVVKGSIDGNTRTSRVLINGERVNYDLNSGFTYTATLAPGKNRIRVLAENTESQVLVKDFYVSYEPKVKAPVNHSTGKRMALVIGNSNYSSAPKLNNTINDANIMEKELKSLGFDVIKITDGGYEQMKNAVFTFGDLIQDVDMSLFYYAGHGLEVEGVNYLIPVDAAIQSAIDVKLKAIPLPGVVRTMEFANDEGLNMIILDACRNNPFPTGKRSSGTGLAKVEAPSGTIIAYSTDPGSVASDGESANGLYTGELVKQISISQRIEDVFMNTRNSVEKMSNGAQRPWEVARLKGVFYLK